MDAERRQRSRDEVVPGPDYERPILRALLYLAIPACLYGVLWRDSALAGLAAAVCLSGLAASAGRDSPRPPGSY